MRAASGHRAANRLYVLLFFVSSIRKLLIKIDRFGSRRGGLVVVAAGRELTGLAVVGHAAEAVPADVHHLVMVLRRVHDGFRVDLPV